MNKIKRYKKILEIARALKPTEQERREFHVSVLFYKNRIVLITTNKTKTHPKNLQFKYHQDSGLHSELRCVIKGGREDYSKYSIWVVRIDNNGEKAAMSKPCSCCQNLLNQVNMGEIYYSISEDKYGKII